jgi:hypothetical protein
MIVVNFNLETETHNTAHDHGDELIREIEEDRRQEHHDEHGDHADGCLLARGPCDFSRLRADLLEKFYWACFGHSFIL